MIPPGRLIAGRYQLLALLATGGMAEIYLARQVGTFEGFDRFVVVKKILPQLAKDKDFLDLFVDEARIAAQLNHPNIVKIYDLVSEGSDYFIVMEYLEGEDVDYLFTTTLETGHKLPQELAAGIVAQVCAALEYAHGAKDKHGKPHNIIHRDVTKQNMIVLLTGDVKLVDFGIVKAASQIHRTSVGVVRGKLTYMSPEQCLCKPIDSRTDIFSLGVVLWELLARMRLFKRRDDGAVVHAIVYEKNPTIRQFQKTVSKELEAIALRALEKDPKDRYQTADEMGADINEYIRRTGAAAGKNDIAAFVKRELAAITHAKRQLLDRISSSENKNLPLDVSRLYLSIMKSTVAKLKSESKTGSVPWGPDDEEDSTERSRSVQLEPEEDDDEDVPTERSRSPLLEPEEEEHTTQRSDLGIDVEKLALPATPHTEISVSRAAFPWSRRKQIVAAILALPVMIGLLVWLLIPSDSSTGPTASGETPGSSEPIDVVPPTSPEPEPAPLVPSTDASPPPETSAEPVALEPEPLEPEPLEPELLEPEPLKPENSKPKRSKSKTRHSKSKPGVLRLDTEPWCEVYLGRRKLGITPLHGVKLPAGKHKLTVVNKKQKLKKTIRVTIKPGKTTTLLKKFTD